MKQKLFFIWLLLSIILISNSYAQTSIPQEILHQEIGRITRFETGEVWIEMPSVYTILADWNLSTEEEAELIAYNFLEDHQDELGISITDLTLVNSLILSIPTLIEDYGVAQGVSGSVTYAQSVQGIPVYDGRIRFSLNGHGIISKIKYQLMTNITAPTTPTITSEDSIEIVKEQLSQTDLKLREDPKLYIFSFSWRPDKRDDKLVWYLNIDRPIYKEIMVDSQSSEIVLERSNIVTGPPEEEEESLPNVTEEREEIPTKKEETNYLYYIIPIIIIILLVIIILVLKSRKK